MNGSGKPGVRQPGVFLTAQWRWLLMLHHEVSPSVLQPRLPRGTELDPCNGRHLLGLVAFRFLDTRLLGLPVPFHRDFEELNLRFYVRRKVEGRWRRGVVFLSEFVPRRAVAVVARLSYGEPHSRCAMSSRVIDPAGRPDAIGEVDYRWSGRRSSGRVAASFAGAPFPFEPDSTAAFVAERSFGYNGRRPGRLLEYEVAHDPWRAWTAASHRAEGDWARLHGPDVAEALSTPAVSALIAEGGPVRVMSPQRLPA